MKSITCKIEQQVFLGKENICGLLLVYESVLKNKTKRIQYILNVRSYMNTDCI